MDIDTSYFEDPTFKSSGKMDENFLSPSQKKIFSQYMTQDVQHQMRQEDKKRQERKREFQESQ